MNANPPVPGGDGLSEILAFSVPNSGVDFSFVPHPTGKYVYIIMHESHYILRSNYDKETGKLVTPYIVCGQSGQADYKDLVGINARLNKPGQGVFVYNKEYEDAGKEDHYDFYFTDTKNHCIRKLTQMELSLLLQDVVPLQPVPINGESKMAKYVKELVLMNRLLWLMMKRQKLFM